MIISYFLISFIQTTTIYFTVLLGLFLSCNLVIKMPIVHHTGIIPVLIMLLLPVMTLFALPLASSMAVHMVVTEHHGRDELVIASFLPRVKQAIRYCVILFALLCSFLYAIFVFYLAPQGYVLSKRLFFSVAKDQFLQVEPGVFHNTIPTISFYVHEKKITKQHETLFEKLILVLRQKNNEQLLISAANGFFDSRQLVLHDGHMVSYKNKQIHTAFFKKTVLLLDAYIAPAQDSKILAQSRFLTTSALRLHAHNNQDAYFELHKRIVQTCWQFVLVLLAFAFALVRKKSSLLYCVLICGMIFLSTYLMISLAQGYSSQRGLCLVLLYGPLILGLLYSLFVIFNKWSKV